MSNSKRKTVLLVLTLLSVTASCTELCAQYGTGRVSKIRWTFIRGRVVEVLTGDSFVVVTETRERKRIRLVAVQAPELDKPFGQEAKDSLSAIILDRNVYIEANSNQSASGPIIGKTSVKTEGWVSVNIAMLKSGFARYVRPDTDLLDPWDMTRYEQAADGARTARLGLWQDAP